MDKGNLTLCSHSNEIGLFYTESLDAASNTWREPDALQVHVTVEVVSTMQKAVDKKAPSRGSFHYVATDYGEHVICVSVSGQSGWFSSGSVVRFSPCLGVCTHLILLSL